MVLVLVKFLLFWFVFRTAVLGLGGFLCGLEKWYSGTVAKMYRLEVMWIEAIVLGNLEEHEPN